MKKKKICAVITAAGSGSRMGEDKNKVLLPLLDIPVAVYSLWAFDACRLIDYIIITCRAEEMRDFERLTERHGIKKVKYIVTGGDTRQKSIENAVSYLLPGTTHIALHDAARPLITQDIIENTLKASFLYGAALPCIPVSDTIKISSGEYVADTPERSSLFAAQTPQCFDADLYKTALAVCNAKGIKVTDDASIVEAIGGRVKITEGSRENIKITYKEDLRLAEQILLKRRRS